MRRYLQNRWFKLGFGLMAAGTGPLVGVILLSAVGLWPDPDPNPIGLGLLSFVSFWPAVFLMAKGVDQVRRAGA